MARMTRMRTYAYTAIDHCTGRRWASQFRARSVEDLKCILTQIYGRGFELLNQEEI